MVSHPLPISGSPPLISCRRIAELAHTSIYQHGQCTVQVFLILEGQLWLLPREDTGAWFKEQLCPPGKDRDWGPVDASSQVWCRPPNWATEGLGNRPVLQYLKDGFKLSACSIKSYLGTISSCPPKGLCLPLWPVAVKS